MNYPVVSENPEIQKEYVRLRKKGQSHNRAEMFSLSTSPGLQTDTRFLHGRDSNGFYSHQLQSWVSSRADVKRISAEKNYECEGSVTHHATDRTEERPYKVDPQLVNKYVQSELVDNPEALRDDPELPTKVAQKLTGRAL